jgi:acyl carrier protein
MELNDFIRNFAVQFEDTAPELITEDTVFQELDEWSSLTVMAIVAFIKTRYDKSVTNAEIRSCETVKELFDLVNSK